MDDKLAKINDHLASRTFLVGNDLTLADLVVFGVTHAATVGRHPNADALYVEEIDVGESAPRQIISGLVKFVPEEAMRGLRVLVVCNLKPAKMREVMSFGMVLCASNETHDQVVPVAVPEGVPNGERCIVEGYEAAPLEEVNPKKKILERLFPDMKTNSEGVPCYKGAVFKTSKGPVTSPLPDAWVK
ncbi:tRNA-binding domain-containing protein, partial [Haematococcus lacustris]